MWHGCEGKFHHLEQRSVAQSWCMALAVFQADRTAIMMGSLYRKGAASALKPHLIMQHLIDSERSMLPIFHEFFFNTLRISTQSKPYGFSPIWCYLLKLHKTKSFIAQLRGNVLLWKILTQSISNMWYIWHDKA